jgi:hypothetical protein
MGWTSGGARLQKGGCEWNWLARKSTAFWLEERGNKKGMGIEFNAANLTTLVFGGSAKWPIKQRFPKSKVQAITAAVALYRFGNPVGRRNAAVRGKPHLSLCLNQRALQLGDHSTFCVRGCFGVFGVFPTKGISRVLDYGVLKPATGGRQLHAPH